MAATTLPEHHMGLVDLFTEARQCFSEGSELSAITDKIITKLNAVGALIGIIGEARKQTDPTVASPAVPTAVPIADIELCEDYIYSLLSIVEYAVDEIHRPLADRSAQAHASADYEEFVNVSRHRRTKSVVQKIKESPVILQNLQVAHDILSRACNQKLLNIVSNEPAIRATGVPAVAMIHKYFADISEIARLTKQPVNWQYFVKQAILVIILMSSIFSSFALSNRDFVAITVSVVSGCNMIFAFLSEIIIFLIRTKAYAKVVALICYVTVTLVGMCASLLYCFANTTDSNGVPIPLKARVPSIATNILTALAYGVIAIMRAVSKDNPVTYVSSMLSQMPMVIMSTSGAARGTTQVANAKEVGASIARKMSEAVIDVATHLGSGLGQAAAGFGQAAAGLGQAAVDSAMAGIGQATAGQAANSSPSSSSSSDTPTIANMADTMLGSLVTASTRIVDTALQALPAPVPAPAPAPVPAPALAPAPAPAQASTN